MEQVLETIDALSKEATTIKRKGEIPKTRGTSNANVDPDSFAAGVRYAVAQFKKAVK